MKRPQSIFKKLYDPNLQRFKTPVGSYKLPPDTRKALRMVATKSSGLKAHRVATDKLRELEFDPIDQLTNQIQEIEDLIEFEKQSKTPRWTYIEKLQALKLRILEVLLPYRYGKAPVVTVEHEDSRDPIKIILSMEDDKPNE